MTGSVISAVKDACRNGLLDWSPRLMLAMYSCDIQASSLYYLLLSDYPILTSDFPADVLGKVYGVVAKRRGRIVAEEMKEGTSFFTVQAMLPVVESFGFADGACTSLARAWTAFDLDWQTFGSEHQGQQVHSLFSVGECELFP